MIPPRRMFLLCVLVVLMGPLAGCQPLIGWFVNAFAPPRKVKPLYVLPSGKKILVFVDDIRNPVSYTPVKGQLTDTLNRLLLEHEVAAEIVPYEDFLGLMAAMPEFNELGIVNVGDRLHADLVLYIHLDEFSLKDNEATPLWTGRMRSKVRLIDVQKGLLKREARLWPEDRPDGYPVKPIELPPTTHPSPRYGEDLAKILADKMAERIARFFYEHKVPAHKFIEQEQEI